MLNKYFTTSDYNKFTRNKLDAKITQKTFIGQSYYNNDGAQLYLTFQPIYKTTTTFSGLSYTIS